MTALDIAEIIFICIVVGVGIFGLIKVISGEK
ncbi:hypothetical protein HMPREF1019_01552 [Campylobacter sp. 10_1_50]|jgi:hypothetical protein|nr:hypothetical protein HMPREF1019_01552 [Campylobacter sp. 10_1_50]